MQGRLRRNNKARYDCLHAADKGSRGYYPPCARRLPSLPPAVSATPAAPAAACSAAQRCARPSILLPSLSVQRLQFWEHSRCQSGWAAPPPACRAGGRSGNMTGVWSVQKLVNGGCTAA